MGLCYLRTALLLKDVTKLRPIMLITVYHQEGLEILSSVKNRLDMVKLE